MLKLYDLLEKIQKRPALYHDEPSISHLRVFLGGYAFACWSLNVEPDEDAKDFEAFQAWIERCFRQTGGQSWAKIILFYSHDEAHALERFFELLAEFRTRQP